MRKYLESLADKAEAKKKAKITPGIDQVRYAGLNMRLLSNMIDTIVIVVVMMLVAYIGQQNMKIGVMPADTPPQYINDLQLFMNQEIPFSHLLKTMIETGIIQKAIAKFMVSIVVSGVILIFIWKRYNATPGKMLLGMEIVDSKTLGKPSTKQYILRFFGYIISILPAGAGFFIISFNKKRRGLHDFIAGTMVIYTKKLNPKWEKRKFKFQVYLMVAMLVIAALYVAGHMQK